MAGGVTKREGMGRVGRVEGTEHIWGGGTWWQWEQEKWEGVSAADGEDGRAVGVI